MRAAALLAAALLALASTRVHGVANCADCPSGTTCLLENKALALTGGASSLALQFCNFDAAKTAEYALAFSLQKPIKCDPNATLLPKVTALTAPSGGCPAGAAPCAVTAALAKPVDWAIVLKNDADVSVLQAKLAGSDEVVQVAQGTGDAGAAGVTGDNAGATVCAASFSVKAARLSTLSACNKVSLCRGKPADTGCTVPVPDTGALFVDDVTCAAEACSGTIALANALPCEAATDGNSAVLVSLAVANAANSSYASIATLAAAPAATASAASGVTVGSSKVTITTDATCQAKSLNVTFDGLPIKDLSATNGSIDITLESKLTQAGSNYDIVVTQCGVPSQKTLTVTVVESGDEALTPAVTGSSLNATAGSGTSGTVGDASPTGSQNTQKQNASTGLPYGLYIAIGVGVLALIGFAVECVYHRRRHSKEHGPGNGDNAHV